MKFIVVNELIASSGKADEARGRTPADEPEAVVVEPLEYLAAVIRMDASHESMKYVLRSDTRQDGE